MTRFSVKNKRAFIAIAVLLFIIEKGDRRLILSQFKGAIKRAYGIKPLQKSR